MVEMEPSAQIGGSQKRVTRLELTLYVVQCHWVFFHRCRWPVSLAYCYTRIRGLFSGNRCNPQCYWKHIWVQTSWRKQYLGAIMFGLKVHNRSRIELSSPVNAAGSLSTTAGDLLTCIVTAVQLQFIATHGIILVDFWLHSCWKKWHL